MRVSSRRVGMPERRIILFSGRVHGVGFRITAVHSASDLSLGGTVRNTDEGDVELVVEGEERQTDELVGRFANNSAVTYVAYPSVRRFRPASRAAGSGLRFFGESGNHATTDTCIWFIGCGLDCADESHCRGNCDCGVACAGGGWGWGC